MIQSLVALLLLASAPAVRDAREHLAQHQLDNVLFDLDKKPLTGADAKEAALVLGKAAVEARADALLSLQFAQMALKYDPADQTALEAGARAAWSQKQFDLAEPLADRWVTASHHGSHASLLRAQIAFEEGDWQLAATLTSGAASAAEEDRAAMIAIHRFSEKQLHDRKAALSEVRGMERSLQAAMAHAGTLPTGRHAPASGATPASASVVVYGTAWCGYCKQARHFFAARHIEFEDKDVEKDPAAMRELASKAAAANMHPQGVPVIDVHGTLISGFDVRRIEAALR